MGWCVANARNSFIVSRCWSLAASRRVICSSVQVMKSRASHAWRSCSWVSSGAPEWAHSKTYSSACGQATRPLRRKCSTRINRPSRAWWEPSCAVESIMRVADPSDIYQSVMASFFIRVSLGEYDISGPAQLTALLKRIAKNKVADLARSPASRRGLVPIALAGQSGIEIVDPAKGPASQVMWNDLVEQARKRFTDDERKVSDLRTQGLNWDEVAAARREE